MIAVLGLLALADMGLWAASWHGGLNPGIMLIGHMMLSCCALLSWWQSGRRRRFAPVLATPLGPLGILLAIFALPVGAWIYRCRFGERQEPVEKDDAMLPRSPARTPNAMVARLLDGRVRYPDPHSLGSLLAVLRQGDIDERRGALEATVRKFDPRLSSIVAQALTDGDQTIRALAAAAASRIAQKLAEDRLAFAQALAVEDRPSIDRLGSILWDHSQFDLLLSVTQRNQIARDVTDATALKIDQLSRERTITIALNESWKKQDFAAIDQICGSEIKYIELTDGPLHSAARWWAQQSC